MSKLDTLATIDAYIINLNNMRRHADANTSDWLWTIVAHLTDLADDLESEAVAETLARN
jgi:hypothetical protein